MSSQQVDDGGTSIYITSIVGVILCVPLTYLTAILLDRFCRTDISEQYLARIIARLELRDENERRNKKTIFLNMTEEERRNVLEKVLLRKPYSDTILDEISSQRAEEGEEKLIKENITEYKPQSRGNWLSNIPFIKEGGEEEEEKKCQNVDSDHQEEKCAICLESYEIGTDVTIGHKCIHMYHTRCILKWLSAKHDFCPFCRQYLFDVHAFKEIAEKDLTRERFAELVNDDDPVLVAMYMDDVDINEEVNETIDNVSEGSDVGLERGSDDENDENEGADRGNESDDEHSDKDNENVNDADNRNVHKERTSGDES
jgi:hypothetical protein